MGVLIDDAAHAAQRNVAYVLGQRGRMRACLASAAQQGTLAFSNEAQLPAFTPQTRGKFLPTFKTLFGDGSDSDGD